MLKRINLISEDVMLEAKDDNLQNSSDKIIEKAEAIIVSAC